MDTGWCRFFLSGLGGERGGFPDSQFLSTTTKIGASLSGDLGKHHAISGEVSRAMVFRGTEPGAKPGRCSSFCFVGLKEKNTSESSVFSKSPVLVPDSRKVTGTCESP